VTIPGGVIMKAVIFDLGSVLIDYDHQATLAATQELLGMSLAEFQELLGEYARPFGLGHLDGPAFFRVITNRFPLDVTYDGLVTTFCRFQARNERGLAFARSCVRPDVRVGIISNTNPIHAWWLHENVPEFTQFHSVILSDEVGLLKPDPAIYQLSLAQLKIEPAEAIFVDDLPENVTAARELGMQGHLHQDWVETETAVTTFLHP
jgi:epoxide hydrolase-like predicted phosphatase